MTFPNAPILRLLASVLDGSVRRRDDVIFLPQPAFARLSYPLDGVRAAGPGPGQCYEG